MSLSRATTLLLLASIAIAIGFGCASEVSTSHSACSLSSDCATGLICAFQKCSTACATSRDCPSTDMCLKSDKGAVCQKKQVCSRHSECSGEKRCASDGRCRDQCLSAKDCAGSQLCVSGVCADSADLVDGKLPKTLPGDGLGAPCSLSADCPGDYVCLWNGTCGPECTIDRDCPRSYACVARSTGGPGRCTPQLGIPDAGFGDAGGDAGDGSAPFAGFSVATGQHHSCAGFPDGRIKCWGFNQRGQLGLGDTSARGSGPGTMGDNLAHPDLGTARRAKMLALGINHTCAILDNDRVKCWGVNDSGELGLGDTAYRGDLAGEMGDNLPFVDLGTGRSVKRLIAGQHHTCAILDNDRVKCWGHNLSGDLGLEDTGTRGDQPNEMGDNLPFVDLGAGRTVKSLAAVQHTCAILDNDRIKCWGRNTSGQLGLGSIVPRGNIPGGMGDNLPYVDLGTGRTAKSVVTGAAHTCAILDNDRVKCWGFANNGQLGLGNTAARGDQPGELGDSLPFVDLGTGRTAKALIAGREFTCAILDNDQVKCWGSGTVLGVATYGGGAGQMGDNLPYVNLGAGRTAKQLGAGERNVCAVLDTGGIKCWGLNGDGELGLGDVTDRSADTPSRMGDALPYVKLMGPP